MVAVHSWELLPSSLCGIFSSHKTHSRKAPSRSTCGIILLLSICLSNCSGVHEALQTVRRSPVSQGEDVDLPSKSRRTNSERKHLTNAVSELPSVY